MRDDFAAFILTHGRPDRVVTYDTLRRNGYTGPIYLVVDDEDATLPQYQERYGDAVLTFSKAEVARTFDEADNNPDRRTIVYARNACWHLAREVGARYLIQLDDDHTAFSYRLTGRKPENDYEWYHSWKIKSLDTILESFVTFLANTRSHTIATSQGGDHLGGHMSTDSAIRLKRKAMNSLVLDTERPFPFLGRVNEDVSAYVRHGHTGHLFWTYMPLQLDQLQTQANEGGMTDVYRASGTYVKSFYSVLFAPSCVHVYAMGQVEKRLHHKVAWENAVPKLIREEHRKAST